MAKSTIIKNDGFSDFVIGDIVLEGIYRNKKRCGVYKVWYGDRFYIGSSTHILKRAKEHRAAINRYFRNPDKECNVSLSIIQHLKNHQDIRYMRVEVLQDCAASDLHLVEKEWISKCLRNSMCLNTVRSPFMAPYTKKKIEFKPTVITETINLDTLKQFELWVKFLSDLKKLKIGNK